MSARIERKSLNGLRLYLASIGRESPKAHARALNKTVTKARTESSKAIRKQVRLKASYVRERLKIRKASQKNLSAWIRTPARGLLLSRFSTDSSIANDSVSWIKPPPEPPRGIRVKVKPSGGAKVFQGDSSIKGKPFYMVLRSSNRVVIAGRRARPGKKGGKIKVFYGPSMSQVFTDVKDDISEPMLEYQLQQYVRELETIIRGY